MKYHSVYWWLIAIYEQIKHFIRNIICRKLLKTHFGYTKPDLLAKYVLDNQYPLFYLLTSKYPELRNIKKYIHDGRPYIVSEFVLAGIFHLYNKKISVFWTNEGVSEDIYFLLNNGIPIIIILLNNYNTSHSVLIVGYDDKDNIIINDPLGDPWTKYKIIFGFNISMKKQYLLKLAGEKMKMSFFIDNKNKETISEIKLRFDKRKLFFLENNDFN
jgi:hypothetical protein